MERGSNFRRFVPDNVSDGHVAFDNEIYRCVNGSELYGTSIESGDHDEIGVYIEPLEYVVGFKRMDSYQWRTQPEGVRSGPGDIDLSMYSLRKYMNLVMVGNPSLLLTLFVPEDKLVFVSHDLRDLATLIVSKKAHARFLGYLTAQQERFLGIKKGHKQVRQDLEDKYGYDTKYAMHAIRLGMQGIELMETGKITLPIPNFTHYQDIRRGKYTYEEMVAYIEDVRQQLKDVDTSEVPDEPNYKTLVEWMQYVHVEHWGYEYS